MLKGKLLLILIIALSAFMRFYQLGSNPPGLDWDETAHGYNAYSILKTGRDEYGYFMPLSFRSFDDYKPPLYTYMVVPSVAVFGLNNFAVRFPSAVLGILAVLFTYLMADILFKSKKIALLAAFFLAVSPWHLQFSRVAFETNSSIFFSVTGTWLFLKSIEAKAKSKFTFYMSLAALVFGANLFIYHNSRVFVPLLAIVLMILYRKLLIQNIKYLILPAIISAFFIATLIPIMFSVAGQMRFNGTSIFAMEEPRILNTSRAFVDYNLGLGILGKVFHNNRLVYVPILAENYLSHLKPEFLFFDADMERHHAPLVGLLYLWDLPFILAGIYFLARKPYPKNSKIIVFSWFLAAPIAASVTSGVPHALRSEIYLPSFQIFIALGSYNLYKIVKYKKAFVTIISSFFIANFAFYLLEYYIQMPTLFSDAWYGNRKQAVETTQKLKNKYTKVVVSINLEQPYMFWLYYSKYDPKKYQGEGGTASGGFNEQRNKFDKYIFVRFGDQNFKKEPGTLYVGRKEDFPQNIKPLFKIQNANGRNTIYIVG